MSRANVSIGASHTKMRIKVDDGDGSVNRVDRPKQRKDDCVVATKCDDPRMMFSIERDGSKFLPSHRIVTQRRICFTVKQRLVSVFDLLDSKFVVIWTNDIMEYSITIS